MECVFYRPDYTILPKINNRSICFFNKSTTNLKYAEISHIIA